ncbi:hypothetical protein [Dactylosporangium sp. NPDC005555]|uniref:hypothetical protein n=1 Tax=Dactylosporangium sp. NPDC005555 TaxID=3154889 RepID=UPI0033ACDB50
MSTFDVASSWPRDVLPRRGGAPARTASAATWATRVATLVATRPSRRSALIGTATPADLSTHGFAHPGVGDVTEPAEQVLRDVWIAGPGQWTWTGDRPHVSGELDPVTVSEIIRDLREVMQ